jgi:protein involved in temperature-dependent protein secretion
MDQIEKILEHDWDAANQRGQEALATGPLADSAYYDQPTGKIVIELNNGVGLHIPPTLIQGMESATPADMAEIVLEGHGIGLRFPRLDADLYVPALARGVLGTSAWMRSLGRKGGTSKSSAKAEAARRNGRLGGRPPSTEKKAVS